ncbi:hypothetical protein ACFOTA_23370 [Chitinophaga sp. GCM10012297]|uniref:DUF4595 domain-containing protein n=1 Tax=Chitinophaga chungangae TaxID=2821488 RepID=A0ABS3YL90_9BACT|nr:hypothetical protein [Chitinophaga chungangae]MBO9155170.1 hypothetical protein [Chitinophaga chungangae]
MKKALLGLAFLATLYGCSKKNDDNTTPELHPDKYVVTRVTGENDSLVLVYNEAGLVSKFSQWEGAMADSFEVSYSDKGLSEFKYFALTGKRTDRRFVYDDKGLIAVNYYNMDNNGQLIITDKDSLVYKDGKLSEYHEISGGMRNVVYKLTWLGVNVDKVEYFLVNSGTEIPVSVTTYAYGDKAGYQHAFPADFMLRYEKHNFSHLSGKTLVKEEQKAAGSGVLIFTANYTTTYNDNGYPKEIKVDIDDKQNNETSTSVLKLEYALLQ